MSDEASSQIPSPFTPPRRSWIRKFADAFLGVAWGVRGENSFLVHLPAAVGVIALGLWLQVDLVAWSLLTLCISSVIAAELFNSAIERLARGVETQHNPLVHEALNISSGAVLIVSLGSVVVGACVLLRHLA